MHDTYSVWKINYDYSNMLGTLFLQWDGDILNIPKLELSGLSEQLVYCFHDVMLYPKSGQTVIIS